MSTTASTTVARRRLHFSTISEALAEVDRLVEAERDGHLTRAGNWTLGQTLGHLATWAEYAFEPCPLKPPFFVRWFMRLQKNRMLYKPMSPNIRIPRVSGGTLGTDPLPLDQSLPRFRRAFERLASESPTQPSSILGKLTQAECVALNLRHGELHLGYFVPSVGS
jgi:hypothetical protein